MLRSVKELMDEAVRYNYAVPAFNFANLESLQAVLMAAGDFK
ncbi:MAG TPA: fructose-bisphosphate aldolase, partial [Eubacteriaceae bacterium]|nr:fructose-bisphosphate aldolase [Eubacteriaceae bacterium]